MTLNRDDINELLTVTLENMYFEFRGEIYRQTDGLPMGASTSAILAILFMDKLETIALRSARLITNYRRYVDDIYFQTTNEEHAIQFQQLMNAQHSNIKFEIVKPTATPNGQTLSLLDFSVTITDQGTSSFEFYKKTPRNPCSYTNSPPSQANANVTSF